MTVHSTTFRGTGLWWSWFCSATIGEFLGFTAPATVRAVLADAQPVVLFPALVAAGAAEGTALGTAQVVVLRRHIPGLAWVAYVLATAAAAMLAWAIALLPMLLGNGIAALRLAGVVPAAALGALVVLGSIGTAQWFVLRRRLPEPALWIPATGVARAAGLLVFLALALPLWQPGQPVLTVIALEVLAGLAMAATVAAVTGWALCRWLLPGR